MGLALDNIISHNPPQPTPTQSANIIFPLLFSLSSRKSKSISSSLLYLSMYVEYVVCLYKDLFNYYYTAGQVEFWLFGFGIFVFVIDGCLCLLFIFIV